MGGLRIGIPTGEATIKKARAGRPEQGPRPGHKYVYRVRIPDGHGGLTYRYYYADDIARARHEAAQVAARKQIEASTLPEEAKKRRLAEMAHEQTALVSDYKAEQAHLQPASIPLAKLDITEALTAAGLSSPPEVIASKSVAKTYGTDIEAEWGGHEPTDLHGLPLHYRRATELAFRSLPPPVLAAIDGKIKAVSWVTGRSDEFFQKNPKKSAYWDPATKTIVIAADRAGLRPTKSGDNRVGFNGGMSGVCVLASEIAHVLKYEMLKDPTGHLAKGMPSWNEWVKFFQENVSRDLPANRREVAVSRGAQRDVEQGFADSLAAAILYPADIGFQSPKTYDFMRRVGGEDYLHPRRTDNERVRALQTSLESAADPVERRRLMRAIDAQVGLNEMNPGDNRLSYWSPPKTTLVGAAIRVAGSPNYMDSASTFVAPPDADKLGQQGKLPHDRFYEMSYNGRTVFLRVGPVDGSYSGWDPAFPRLATGDKALQTKDIRPDEIKEVYDEAGRPLDRSNIYWHMLQDLYDDPNVAFGVSKVGEKFVPVTIADVVSAEGGLTRGSRNVDFKEWAEKRKELGLPATQALYDKTKLIRAAIEGNAEPKKLFVSLQAQGNYPTADGTLKVPKALSGTYEEWKKDRSKNPTQAAIGLSEKDFLREKEETHAFQSMVPQEITFREFRQRSGTFVYDTLVMAGADDLKAVLDLGGAAGETDRQGRRVLSAGATITHREALERLKESQPGLELVVGRDERGHFTKGRVALDHQGRPMFTTMRYENVNPDGTKTTIITRRGADGQFYLEDPMWAALLTPGGEPVGDARSLRLVMQRAAAEHRRAWVSIETDRQRVRKGNRWVLAEAGQDTHLFHMQVEFDGRGSPKILGDTWASRLHKPEPRIIDLLTSDRAITFRETRSLIEAEQIVYQDTPERLGPPMPGDRVVLTATAAELGANEGRDVVVQLDHVNPEKAAGTPPAPPTWQDVEGLRPPGRERPATTLTKKEKEWKAAGLLPAHYVGTARQREWLNAAFVPAMHSYEVTKEAKTAQAYPRAYVFRGEKGEGKAAGRTFVLAEDQVNERIRAAQEGKVPRALEQDLLVYPHSWVDPKTGESRGWELRVLLPRGGDNRWTAEALEQIPGVTVRWRPQLNDDDPHVAESIALSPDDFYKFRRAVGSVSLTGVANDLIASAVDAMSHAHDEKKRDVTPDMEDMDPGKLVANLDVELNPVLPNGSPFTVAEHQSRGARRAADNAWRMLLAHYMGTGKTITAILTLKLAQRLRAMADAGDPAGDPEAPKRVIIVAPKSTVEQWKREVAMFDGGAQSVGTGSNDVSMDRFKQMSEGQQGSIIVVGPEYFTGHADELKAIGFDGLIIDEAHLGLKASGNRRLKKVQEMNKDLKMLLMLTGTAMTLDPSDIVEYGKLLSKGAIWSDMDQREFARQNLETSDSAVGLGLEGSGPKTQIKNSKRGEIAALLSPMVDVARTKDIKGKVLPSTRFGEDHHEQMRGLQADLYNLFLAIGGADASGAVAALTAEERGGDMARAAATARQIANTPAFKPRRVVRKGGEAIPKTLGYETIEVDDKGTRKKKRKDFEPWTLDWLMSSKSRGPKAAGRWPQIDEVEPAVAAIYSAYFQDTLGGSYSEVAGTVINEDQKPKIAKWPTSIRNPEIGPPGLVFRGESVPWDQDMDRRIGEATRKGDNAEADRLLAEMDKKHSDIDRAQQFQRAVRVELQANADAYKALPASAAIEAVAERWSIDAGEARRLLNTTPDPYKLRGEYSFKWGGKTLTVKAPGADGTGGTEYVSDDRGSLHILYTKDDWDEKTQSPKHHPLADARVGDVIDVKEKTAAKLGLDTAVDEEGDDAVDEESGEKAPPVLRYAGKGKGDNILVTRSDTGDVVEVPSKEAEVRVPSLMDPGRREERAKADIVATLGSAKVAATKAVVSGFFADGGASGPDGPRQFIIFGHDILSACRVSEAMLRTMGFRDVNECIEGSPHFDPTDPSTPGGMAPNGKYFVTYIGSTYTGDRDMNVAIFRKTRGPDGLFSDESEFVAKTMKPRSKSKVWVTDPETGAQRQDALNWAIYKGDNAPCPVRRGQWSEEERTTIKRQFGIVAPESFVEVVGPDDTLRTLPFYGTPESTRILHDIVEAGDPTALPPGAERAAAQATIAKLKDRYITIAQQNAKAKPPLSQQQITVFNNCVGFVASDAAQVGMNLPNATEQIQFDSLASPTAEMQRVTRSARLQDEPIDPVLDHRKGHEFPRTRFHDAADAKASGYAWSEKADKGKGGWTALSDGPMTKIRDAEPTLFQAQARGIVDGRVVGLRLDGGVPNGGRAAASYTFSESMGLIQAGAKAAIDEIRANGRVGEGEALPKKAQKEMIAAWERIGQKAAIAARIGNGAIKAALDDFAGTTVPGSTQSLLAYTTVDYKDPKAGTYDKVIAQEPTNRIGEAIDALSEFDRSILARSRYGEKNRGADPKMVYLGLRGQEILAWMRDNTARIGASMRAEAGGEVVTENAISKMVVDSLTPQDRAILKTLGLLANIERISVAGPVGQVVERKYGDGRDKITERVALGWEQASPVQMEQATAAIRAARDTGFERFYGDIEHGVDFDAQERTFSTARASSIAHIAEMRKALVPVFYFESEET